MKWITVKLCTFVKLLGTPIIKSFNKKVDSAALFQLKNGLFLIKLKPFVFLKINFFDFSYFRKRVDEKKIASLHVVRRSQVENILKKVLENRLQNIDFNPFLTKKLQTITICIY